MSVQKVMIVGAGLMGSGIAQICAQAGIQANLYDFAQEALEKAMINIEWSVGKFIEKGKLSEDKETILGRIEVIKDIHAASGVDLAVEAVFENIDVKQEIFRQLDRECSAKTLIASNTSAIPITELAAVTRRPEKILGLHFF
ncbi:MAG: 3-hydroxybutyryl-CoA dehydrogenase, partial [Desulfobacterales bacterium]|nr:3-hydroxybutyryl-CoA dehydrogenase [Desulfobacterales bacterium]